MLPRQTRQKQSIQQEVDHYSSFFTADDLYTQIHKKDPSLGIATIYRYLKTVVEQQKIHSFSCNRKTIYSNNSKNHCHFRCERCSTIQHLSLKNIDSLQQNLKGKMCHFQIDITGICEECLKK